MRNSHLIATSLRQKQNASKTHWYCRRRRLEFIKSR